MIDRKAFRISAMILLAVIAATLWRLSLVADWRHVPFGGSGSHNSVSGLFLFAVPASSLISMVMLPLAQWLTMPEETLPAWRRWSGKWVISWSVFMALMQAFVLARSLNLVWLSGLASARACLVMMGIIFMMLGNAAPKMPSMPQRASFELDRSQQNRLLRLAGKLFVGVGLVFVLGGILLPMELWKPVFLCLMLAALAAGVWYNVKLRHERSLQ